MSIGYKQAKVNNTHFIPTSLFRKMCTVLNDYERMVSEAAELRGKVKSAGDMDGMPKGSGTSDPTQEKALRIISRYSYQIDAVDRAKKMTKEEFGIPDSFVDAIIENITNRKRYPDGASYKTWKKYKGYFIFCLAYNLDELDAEE